MSGGCSIVVWSSDGMDQADCISYSFVMTKFIQAMIYSHRVIVSSSDGMDQADYIN